MKIFILLLLAVAGTQVNGMSSQVYFFASRSSGIDGYADTVIYDEVLLNIGGGYNSNTGKFTCPVSGVYQFSFSTNNARGGVTNVWLMVNGNYMMLNHVYLPEVTSVNQSLIMLRLQKGSIVWLRQSSGKTWSMGGSRNFAFGGWLMVEDHLLPLEPQS